MPALTIADLTRVVASATREEKLALREALKVGQSPESAAAAEAFTGKGNVCTVAGFVNGKAVPGCGRALRTAARAAIHGVDNGGHTAGQGWSATA